MKLMGILRRASLHDGGLMRDRILGIPQGGLSGVVMGFYESTIRATLAKSFAVRTGWK